MTFRAYSMAFLVGGMALAQTAVAADYYANGNRDLFSLPHSSAVARSDEALNRDGTPASNPAALTTDSVSLVALSYAGLYQNSASVSNVSSVTSLSASDAFSVSVGYLLVPNIELSVFYPVDNAGNVIVPPESERTYGSASEIFFRAGFAHRFVISPAVNVHVGAAVNAQRRRLPDTTGFVTGYGMGLDGGALAEFPRTGLIAGFTLRDMTTNYMNWTSAYSENAPPQLHLTVGWNKNVPYMYGRFKVTLTTLDLLGNEGVNGVQYADPVQFPDSAEKVVSLKPSDAQFYLCSRIGLEYSILDIVALRAGVSNATDLSFGAGVNLFKKRLGIDFSYLLHDLAGSYLVGLTYSWR